jgi:hypothetical protein
MDMSEECFMFSLYVKEGASLAKCGTEFQAKGTPMIKGPKEKRTCLLQQTEAVCVAEAILIEWRMEWSTILKHCLGNDRFFRLLLCFTSVALGSKYLHLFSGDPG